MDSGHRSKRMFPGYTTAQLREFAKEILESGDHSADACMKYIALQDEIDARESGRSVPFKTPQVPWT